MQTAAYELGIDPAELRRKNFIQPEQFPYTLGDRLRVRLGRLRAPRCDQALERVGYEELREEQAQGARGGPPDRDRPRELHRGRRRGAEQALRHPRDQDVRLGRAARAPDGQGDPEARRQVAGPGPRDDVRADRRRTSSASRPQDIKVHGGRHRQHAVRARHLRVALDADRRRGDRDGLAQARATRRRRSPRTCSRRRRGRRAATTAQFSVKGAPRAARSRSRTSRSPPTRTCPRAWSPASRACTTTTRRT